MTSAPLSRKDALSAAGPISRLRVQIATGQAKALRQAAGMSQRETAALIGVQATNFSRAERGKHTFSREASCRWIALLDALAERVDPDSLKLL
jgi:DNA-binding XRE family transcriptional regulator